MSTRPVEWKRVGPTGSTIAFLDATGSSGQAFAINENGRAVGGDGGYPVRFERTAPVPIGPGPNYGDTAALAVNENGLAVGEILAGPFVFNSPNGTFINLQPPQDGPYNPSAATGVNRGGNVVGYCYCQNQTGAARYFGFSYNIPSGSAGLINYSGNTYINALNNGNEYVGLTYPDESGYGLDGPFQVTPNGGFSLLADLLPANAPLSPITATALNDRGQIVGQALFPSEVHRAYLLEPAGLPPCRLSPSGYCK